MPPVPECCRHKSSDSISNLRSAACTQMQFVRSCARPASFTEFHVTAKAAVVFAGSPLRPSVNLRTQGSNAVVEMWVSLLDTGPGWLSVGSLYVGIRVLGLPF